MQKPGRTPVISTCSDFDTVTLKSFKEVDGITWLMGAFCMVTGKSSFVSLGPYPIWLHFFSEDRLDASIQKSNAMVDNCQSCLFQRADLGDRSGVYKHGEPPNRRHGPGKVRPSMSGNRGRSGWIVGLEGGWVAVEVAQTERCRWGL